MLDRMLTRSRFALSGVLEMNRKLPIGSLLAGVALAVAPIRAAPFEPLFRVVDIKGDCQIRKPGAAQFEPVLRNKAYPYGTTVQTLRESAATVQLSSEDAVRLDAETIATPTQTATGNVAVAIHFEAGKLVSNISAGMPADLLAIESVVARCNGLTGRGELTLSRPRDAFVLSAVATAGGTMTLSGPQFVVPTLKAGYGVRITTTRDRSLTRIVNTLGDYAILVDKGAEQVSIDTSTRSTIRIWREAAPVGGRLIVSVFATGPDGKGKESFAFAVGQPTVATTTHIDTSETPEETNAPPSRATAPAEGSKTEAGGDGIWK
jgi:hypothetical protein